LITEEYCLTQLISEPTHLTPTSETLIDVIFTSHPDIFTSSGTFPFSNSDHLLIYQSCTKVCCYKNCNVEAFLAYLYVTPWHTVDIFASIDDKLDYWKSLFTSVVEDHFPLCTVCLRSHSVKWMNVQVAKLIRSHNYFHTKFKCTKRLSDWNKFKLLKKAIIRELWRAKAEYFANVGNTIAKNPWRGWNLLNAAV